MSAPIEGFIAAIVLSILVVIWIAYCMFCRERHRDEHIHYVISDLRQKNYEIAQDQDVQTKEKKSELRAGIFILPSRHRHKDESYDKRPDYPESPMSSFTPGSGTGSGTEKLVEIFNDNVDADVHYKDGIYEIDTCSQSQYHSDV